MNELKIGVENTVSAKVNENNTALTMQSGNWNIVVQVLWVQTSPLRQSLRELTEENISLTFSPTTMRDLLQKENMNAFA